MVAAGDLELCYFSSSYLSQRVPALGIFDIPFQFTDRRDTKARLDGDLDGDLGALLKRDIAARTDYVVLDFWDNGLRHLSNGKRPVCVPGDCTGLRIRTLPSAGYHAAFRALGMTPVTIDVGVMMQAIASGEVDAQENPLTTIRLFGIEHYHPHVTTTACFHGIAPVLCNAKAWASWPGDVRAALRAAFTEATAAQWRFAAEDDVTCRADLTAKGVGIVDLDDDARAAFRQAVRSVIDEGYAALPRELDALRPDVSRI